MLRTLPGIWGGQPKAVHACMGGAQPTTQPQAAVMPEAVAAGAPQ